MCGITVYEYSRYKNCQIYRILTQPFVHAKYTSSMAPCYDNDISDVMASHVSRVNPENNRKHYYICTFAATTHTDEYT